MIRKLQRVSGSLQQAKAELRWMKDAVKSYPIDKQQEKLDWFITRRLRHVPLQYILGSVDFLGLNILTRPPVLIPRWETEEITERLVNTIPTMDAFPNTGKELSKITKVVELCCGSGCISLALSHYHPSLDIDAFDISKSAVRLSKLNQRKLNTNVDFQIQDIFKHKFKDYDLLVCNPPYVTPSEYENLAKSLYYEDKYALVTKDKLGLEFYEYISSLKISKYICFEIGEKQATLVQEILQKNGYSSIVYKDMAGKDRSIFATSQFHS
ncbi:HemK methyltransferase member 1 [Boothiomyces macroporosus]|uniref:peptide chain release factor N(5)-glutamine methyltransferase n=1 Tax=Boothiomyces macroporosus TaxID=261099 RepID=A0AAD5UFQ5_9FUNG|nr:HemK methyltransferase member 1 [Boothiomyces macroporosus]